MPFSLSSACRDFRNSDAFKKAWLDALFPQQPILSSSDTMPMDEREPTLQFFAPSRRSAFEWMSRATQMYAPVNSSDYRAATPYELVLKLRQTITTLEGDAKAFAEQALYCLERAHELSRKG